jgi:hypothetical protein
MYENTEHINQDTEAIVQKVAEIYHSHTMQWFIGLAVHGSALKGGFIKGWSDIDFQLYLNDSAFNEFGQLPLPLCLSIHRDLSNINPYPFQYIQTRVLSPFLPQYGGLVPHTYKLVSGRMLLPDLTDEELYKQARVGLSQLNPARLFPTGCLLEHGDDRLLKQVRAFCTVVWPVLFQILTLQNKYRGIEIWGLTKTKAIELLPLHTSLGHDIRDFYKAVVDYYPNKASIENALLVVETGVAFLHTAKKWWHDSSNL